MTPSRALGLDIGQKRIGVALSDPDGRVAFSRGTIVRDRLHLDLDEVQRLVVENGVEVVVIGLPRSLSGQLGPQAERVQRFGTLVKERVDVSVEYWDERLTTVAAERAMREAGASAHTRRHSIDAVAATLILQGYLDFRRNRERREGGAEE